jgi:fatty acid desaturase
MPLMYVGLPSFYGAWLYLTTGLTQHAGLAEDVLDHRLNSRTVYMNPIVRFLYWNMNYHVEHHMFPTVPYHKLPELHAEMKSDTPTPYSGFWDAYREIIPAVIRQVREPAYFVRRELPSTAHPFGPPAATGVAAE